MTDWLSQCTETEYDEWIDSPRSRAIEEDGAIAYNRFYTNRPIEGCPHTEGTKESISWMNGWSRERGH